MRLPPLYLLKSGLVLFQHRIETLNCFFKSSGFKLYVVEPDIVDLAQLNKYPEGLLQLSSSRAITDSVFFKFLEEFLMLLNIGSKLGLLLNNELHRTPSFFVCH